jgi:hypothetical protein
MPNKKASVWLWMVDGWPFRRLMSEELDHTKITPVQNQYHSDRRLHDVVETIKEANLGEFRMALGIAQQVVV